MDGDGQEWPGVGGPGGRGPPIDPRKTVVPRALVMVLFLGLFVEFVIGVAVSVWGPAIPSSVSSLFGANAGSYGWLSVHAVLAVLLVLLALGLIVTVVRLHRPRLTFGAVGGFLFILLAALAGYGYIASGGNSLYVIFMAVFFLIAWTAYARLAMQLRRATRMAFRRAHANAGAGTPPAA